MNEVSIVGNRQQRAFDDLTAIPLSLAKAAFTHAIVDAQSRRLFGFVIDVGTVEARVPKVPVSPIRT